MVIEKEDHIFDFIGHNISLASLDISFCIPHSNVDKMTHLFDLVFPGFS